MTNSSDELDLRALQAQVAALTERVHLLEQRAGIAPPAYVAPTTPPPPLPPVTKEPARIRTPDFIMRPVVPPDRETTDLEGKIGRVWLNRIGIMAVLAGVAYFIKYAFDNGWIGETGRVVIGLLAGIAVVLWSEWFRKKNYVAFSYSLKAVGIGTLYFSLWGAFQVFQLIPSSVAFAAMILVTAFTITLALTQDAEILAAYALIGGFSTPVLLSTAENHEVVLFSYIALLDLAMLVMARYKPWRRLMWGSFIGTAILYIGWFSQPYFYSPQVRGLTVFFAGVFSAIFATIPLVTPLEKSRRHEGHSATLTLLPVANAVFFFLSLFEMYESEKVTLTWYALALATVYLGLSGLLQRRDAEPGTLKLISMLHIAIAVAFITIAIPLKLNEHWITIGWLIESTLLLFVAVRTQTDFLRYFAGTTLALGIVRLLLFDKFHTQTLVFNARFATYLVAIVILGAVVFFGERVASSREMPVIQLAGIILNLLALIALTLEAHDYFNRQVAAANGVAGYTPHFQDIRLAWDFSYSAVWLAYGAGMMAFGFFKRDAFVRWQALMLMAFTIGKVFTYDTWSLEKGYRILSFIALGMVLMAISFIYQRDWLKLSPRSSDKTAKGTSA